MSQAATVLQTTRIAHLKTTATMKLKRLFAFEIFPQKGSVQFIQPAGGEIAIGETIELTLNQIVVDSKLEKATSVAFHVEDPKSKKRQNEMRRRALGVCFGARGKAKLVADEMAMILSCAMDNRSKPLLLLISSFESNDAQRRIVLWAFPKDEAFKFSATQRGARVEFVPDIFSVSSKLRKAAIFEGGQTQDDFWEGRMLDLQSGTTDLWIEGFLDCRLSVSGKYGTKMMADTIADFYKSNENEESREQIFNAIVAVRTSPVRRMSLARFAKDYMSGEPKESFLASIPSEDRTLTFDFDRSVFESKLGFKLFKMKDDVFVSAPIGTVGTTVKIENARLAYEGEIVEEVLRSTHGRR